VLIPALAMFSGVGFIGWAKPTPVDPRNFKKPVQYDILTSVAGPVSNFLVATLAILVLAVLSALFPSGRETIRYGLDTGSVLVPVVAMLYALVSVNILLAVFNLIPIPPLDGSHVIRHLLPESAQRAYDTMGMVGLILLFVIGRPILRAILPPVMGVFSSLIRVVT
jgi:Zn-dependent protease